MSFVDKFLTAIQLNGDEDQGYYDEPDDSFTSKVESINNQAPIGKDDPSIEVKEEKKPAKVTPRPKKSLSAAGMEVCVIKPTSVEDAREITETLLANRTVVLNLEGLDVDIAQRIIDFTSGSCFAISGNLQKISRYIFIITPASVDISGDFQNILNGTFGGGISEGPQQID
ncbi:MAG: cell division protein SepF [Butyrivibrio sp.]|jgi:cell division inhibitor SepF|uniref:cell division protein SepF n=1 Tax=Butyrivibrio sp. TaxID=28121 RepID=UPI001B479706|nr:cell division protein SepF [Butyrivibrio sp.]MBP3273614.1 cell division protein SepF [Butyrivibrio sp.]MBP3783325.1 cell division protein SepF [Butyrivibrio sp.]MBR1642434.1 cell division protein SepF [Butyrivibrio sp.]